MAYIYKITNLINQKIYIGETTQTIDKRWKQHLYQSFKQGHGYNYHLHAAIRKYGESNFKIEQVEQCEEEARFAREHYYIMYYNSLEPNGYNYLAAGTGSTKVPIEAILELWELGYNTKEIGEKLGIGRQYIAEHLKANNISQEEIIQRRSQSVKERCSMPVMQYDLKGNFIQEWPSATSVQEQGYSQTMVSSVCRQEQITAHGYIWKYKNDDRDIQEWVERVNNKKSSGKPKKPIYQLDLNYNIINEFASAADAAKSINVEDKSNICAAARKGRKAYGYYWEYK